MSENKSKFNNSVRILAVKPLKSDKGEAMHRILKEDVLYQFYSDVKIEEDKVSISYYTPQELFNDNKSVNINISAIVGENGSGKSTIIDYIIRIINNLSAVLFGEYYDSIASEHLHYIQGLYAELYVLVDKIVFRIKCKGDTIIVDSYNFNSEKSKDDIAIFDNKETWPQFTVDYNKPCEENNIRTKILSQFCYTMIVNYSLYSFDTSIYKNELTSEEKEKEIDNRGCEAKFTTKNYEDIAKDDKECFEARSWLTGLMRRLDSYQVPLLITPTRKNGQVDQRREYVKGKEILLSLTLLRDKNNKRVFTQINNKEKIVYVSLKPNPEYMGRTFSSIFDNLLPKLSPPVRLALFNLVKNNLEKDLNISSGNVEDLTAWNYVVYKFFKIVLTYPPLKNYRDFLLTISNRLSIDTISKIKDVLKDVCDIHNHVTSLFWRSIFYLKYPIPRKALKNTNSIDMCYSIEEYSKWVYELENDGASFVNNVGELLPPPFFSVDFELYNVEDDKEKNVIPFETLSSGEKQITLTLSTIYFYLTNIGSSGDGRIINYKHICVILDELELYFHPEMQRNFISRLLFGLKQLNLGNIESIQFLMVTHSPFILSDIPRSNVLFLNRKGEPKKVDTMRTFGANIHEMLEHSFFLEKGTIGAFAKKVIGEIEACLNVYKIEESKEKDFNQLQNKEEYDFLNSFFKKKNESSDEWDFDFDEFRKTYSQKRIKATIELFDEPIIKRVLLNDYYEVFKDKKEKQISNLEHQLASLEEAAYAFPNDESLNNIISSLKHKIDALKNEK